MADDDKAFWGRSDVRGAIALGYVIVGVLAFMPNRSHTAAVAPAAKATTSFAQSQQQVAAATPREQVAAPDPAKQAEIAATIEKLKKITDYDAARWHPVHFQPAIATATDGECLACHQEILTRKVRAQSPAGVAASTSLAWYQTLDTYSGEQETFHARHLSTPFAKTVMNLSCNFCHQGHDPREEAPGASATAVALGGFTLRKVVDPSKSCLLCHGNFPGEVMGLGTDPWHLLREGLESAEQPNGCLSCHAEQFRTVRHQVNYLKAAAIETHAKANSDTCFGCHGGRAWYRMSYPYPRHSWPGMDPAVPDWATQRPTESDARYRIGKAAN